jgi:hypothetical protein
VMAKPCPVNVSWKSLTLNAEQLWLSCSQYNMRSCNEGISKAPKTWSLLHSKIISRDSVQRWAPSKMI